MIFLLFNFLLGLRSWQISWHWLFQNGFFRTIHLFDILPFEFERIRLSLNILCNFMIFLFWLNQKRSIFHFRFFFYFDDFFITLFIKVSSFLTLRVYLFFFSGNTSSSLLRPLSLPDRLPNFNKFFLLFTHCQVNLIYILVLMEIRQVPFVNFSFSLSDHEFSWGWIEDVSFILFKNLVFSHWWLLSYFFL